MEKPFFTHSRSVVGHWSGGCSPQLWCMSLLLLVFLVTLLTCDQGLSPGSPAPARPSPSVIPNPGQVDVQLCGEGPGSFSKSLASVKLGTRRAGRQTQFHFVLRAPSHLGGSCLSHFIHIASSVLHNCQPGPAADVEITALCGLFNQLPQLHQGRFYHLLLISPSDSVFLIKF